LIVGVLFLGLAQISDNSWCYGAAVLGIGSGIIMILDDVWSWFK
jgi:hypothetical protein